MISDFRPSLDTIISHPFFTHDPTKIPSSLPSCCTHVAPDWQEDAKGYLIPVLAETDEQNQRTKAPSSRRKEAQRNQNEAPLRNPYPLQQGKGKENGPLSNQPSNQFEIYTDNQARRQNSARSLMRGSNDGEGREMQEVDFTSQKAERDTNEDITHKFAACNLQDPPTGTGDIVLENKHNDKGSSDKDAAALERMYSRLRDLSNGVEAAGGPKSFRPASPIQAQGAEKWVTRYVDYTSKYGLGFLFSDGR